MSLLLAGAIFLGHHSLASDFDTTKRVTLAGRITKIEWSNPHVHIYIDVKNVHWSVERGSPNGLGQRGWTRKTLAVGDSVSAEGSRAKDGSNRANASTIVLASGVRMSTGSGRGRTS